MDLLWFLLGLAIILCIGRYNESNKLFWILFVSFVGSFTVASVVMSTSSHKNEVKKSTVQVCPTQGQTNASGMFLLADAMLECTKDESSKLVSKEQNIPVCTLFNSFSPLSGERHVTTLIKPPQLCLHTLTHHDSTICLRL